MIKAVNRQIVPLFLALTQKLETLGAVLNTNTMMVLRDNEDRSASRTAGKTELHLLLNLHP
jgi:hypothetical protein